MKTGEIQQKCAESSRWWRDPAGWPKRDHDLRRADEAPFEYSSKVLADLTRGGLYVLRGPRRVGKSVELKLTIKGLIADGIDPRSIIHMPVDGWSASDLDRLVGAADQLMPTRQHRWWFIDEITSIADNWPARIKWLRDNDSQFGFDTVVLTGSSSSKLRESIADLAGRRGRAAKPNRVMLPIGFRTFAELVSTEPMPTDVGPRSVADLTPKRLKDAAYRLAPWLHELVATWDAYLTVGGFPQSVASHINDRQPDRALQESLQGVISGDAFQRARFSDLQTEELLRQLAAGLGSPVNKARIAREVNIDVSSQTALRRIDDLRESFIVWPAYKEQAMKPQLRAQEKIYFTDPVYARLASGSVVDDTAMSEQQLGMALLRSLERDDGGRYMSFDRVLFHRTKTNAEIDFVGPDLGGLAIESKFTDGRWRKRTGRTLQASRWRGLVATRTELDPSDPELIAFPAAMLAWLIDT